MRSGVIFIFLASKAAVSLFPTSTHRRQDYTLDDIFFCQPYTIGDFSSNTAVKPEMACSLRLHVDFPNIQHIGNSVLALRAKVLLGTLPDPWSSTNVQPERALFAYHFDIDTFTSRFATTRRGYTNEK